MFTVQSRNAGLQSSSRAAGRQSLRSPSPLLRAGRQGGLVCAREDRPPRLRHRSARQKKCSNRRFAGHQVRHQHRDSYCHRLAMPSRPCARHLRLERRRKGTAAARSDLWRLLLWPESPAQAHARPRHHTRCRRHQEAFRRRGLLTTNVICLSHV